MPKEDAAMGSAESVDVLSRLGLSDAAKLEQFIAELLQRRDNKPIASVE